MTKRVPTWAIPVAIAGALAGLVAWSAWLRWQALDVSPFPLGVDGYYYPIQLRALLETGSLHYPASPLTFWWMLPFAAASDPITGAKLGAAIGTALIALPAYGVGSRLGKSRGAGLVAAVVAAASASSMYLSMEFVKQGVGLTVALTAIWLVLRALELPSRERVITAAGGVFATLLAHKLAAGIVVAIALPAAIEELRARGVLRGRRLLLTLVGAVVAGIALVVLGVVAPERFVSGKDLALLDTLFGGETRWDAPALVRPGLTLAFENEAGIGGVLAVIAALVVGLGFAIFVAPGKAPPATAPEPADYALRGWRRPWRGGERAVAIGFIVLGLVIAIPTLNVGDAQGLAFRLRVSAYVPLAICSAIASHAFARLLASWQHDLALALVAIVLLVRTPDERIEGRILPHPALVSAIMAAKTKVPANTTLIIPERHILFMTAWYTRAPVSLRPEGTAYGKRMRLLPLHFIQMGSPLDEAIDAARRDERVADPPIPLHARHRNGLVLVSEPTWDWLMAALPARARAYWGPWPTI